MITLQATAVSQSVLDDGLFGANILGYRDRIGESGTYDDVIEDLGAGSIRYPGGSYTEEYFDITDPDRVTVESLSGGGDKENMPYSEFMGWAESEGLGVTVVLPTRSYLSQDVDANGNRFPEVDEEALRGFIRDTLDGTYGRPTIEAFEIGNEYWGSGEMTSVEYGRLASEMAVIIRDEIDRHPEAGTTFSETDIAVQMGQNYGTARLSNDYPETGQDLLDRLSEDFEIEFTQDYLYGDGSGAWPKIANKLVVNEFDTAQERDAIDAVVAHYYSKGEAGERDSFDLGIIEKIWDPEIEGLTRYVTEWNLKSSRNLDPETDYGLKNAHEMLDMIENMTDENVELAHVWAVQQNTLTDLSGDEGQTGLTIPGEMFKMMANTLPGTRKVALAGHLSGRDEVSTGTADAHFFFGDEGGVLYLASTSEEASQEQLDLSSLMSDLGNVQVTRLGVEQGDAPNDAYSDAEITRIDPDAAIEDGVLDLRLDPYEIVMVEFDGATATAELQGMLDEEDNQDIPGDDLPPDTPDTPEPDDDQDDDDNNPDPDDEGALGTCFVATATYGDPYHPDVAWLRAFRDEHLLPHPAGRALLELYWKWGPGMAGILRRNPGLSRLIRRRISAVVRILQNI